MSNENFFVEVVEVDAVQEHTNADALELAIVKGWQIVVRKGQFNAGDIAVHIPPNAIIPEEVSDEWGVTQYLSKGRVRVARLRGEPSYGFLVANDTDAPLGVDLKEYYGISEYEPPEEFVGGDQDTIHPLFTLYASMQNLRNFPTILEVGEEVVCTEKVHGTNSAIGMVLDSVAKENPERVVIVSSRKHPRKMGQDSIYERPYLRHQESMDALFNALFDNPGQYTEVIDEGTEVSSVVIYGEIFGNSVQKGFAYGCDKETDYLAFDILVNGQYLHTDEVIELCEEFDIPMAPILYRGPYSLQSIQEVAEGKTTLDEHIREGVVLRPVKERTHPKIGRVIFKCKNPEYEAM